MKYFNLHQLSPALGLTYANALCGAFGIVAVTAGKIDVAFVLLIIAALFDAFDGVIARLKQQTQLHKRLGTVADSVADMVSFGVLPPILFLSMFSLSWVTGISAAFYVCAAIHRLVVFTGDALETNAQSRYFTGLPVVMGALVLPIGQVVLGKLSWFEPLMIILFLGIAILFISKVSIPKPRGPIAYASYPLIAGLVVFGIVLW